MKQLDSRNHLALSALSILATAFRLSSCGWALCGWAVNLPTMATPLQGRIEEIVGDPNLTLPVEPKQQESPLSPHPLRSLPSTLKGGWKGNLTVSQTGYSPIYLQLEPADAAKDQESVIVGAPAESNFKFFINLSGGVEMAPPMIRVRVNDPRRKNVYLYISSSDFGPSYLSSGGTSLMKMTLLKNAVRQLSADVVEQDTVIQNVMTNKSSGKKTVLFSETVYRFSKPRPKELHAEIAQVQYGGDGAWWEKVVMEGDLH